MFLFSLYFIFPNGKIEVLNLILCLLFPACRIEVENGSAEVPMSFVGLWPWTCYGGSSVCHSHWVVLVLGSSTGLKK